MSGLQNSCPNEFLVLQSNLGHGLILVFGLLKVNASPKSYSLVTLNKRCQDHSAHGKRSGIGKTNEPDQGDAYSQSEADEPRSLGYCSGVRSFYRNHCNTS